MNHTILGNGNNNMSFDVKSGCTFLCTISIFIIISLQTAHSWRIPGFPIFGNGGNDSRNGTPVAADIDWVPSDENFINLPVMDCDVKDAKNQTDFAELRYLNMTPPCEETSKKGYCGIRRFQNITLVSKFVTKNYNEQFRVRVHLVDKNFGFETSVWPEFSACHSFFNVTCPQEPGMVHSYVHTELPREIPPVTAIIRVRLISVNEKQEKNVAICRQISLHII